MNPAANDMAVLLDAIRFAAEKHRDQRRKGASASPYINHPIAVADLLARVGRIDDIATLVAAVLHDTIEDTETTGEELERHFGAVVRAIVEEISDDNTLSSARRKQLQVERSPTLSAAARRIRIADKTCNALDVAYAPPDSWSLSRRRDYLDWTERVVAGCRGVDPALEAHYDAMLARARAGLPSN
jgi:guanosine-3',5'-bis(diphosphate) 3'-pyrophosphohydrolase